MMSVLLQGDALALPLREGTVQTVVTSPPYWGLRDYGEAGQLGLEATPELYVERMVAVFREVRRVLRDDGTCWLNLGDSYHTGDGYTAPPSGSRTKQSVVNFGHDASDLQAAPTRRRQAGLKPKDLVGIPWRVAFALQADGWWLRSDIVWSKPNPMPESITDRPTKAHEYVFLLAKQERYFYDAEAVKERAATEGYDGVALESNRPGWSGNPNVLGEKGHALPGGWQNGAGRNRRSVWTIATQPYAGAHFATFPEALVEPCVLAGAPAGGLVLDPFAGSGTVAVVCARLGRRFVGVELSAAYCQLAKQRAGQLGLV